MSEQETLLGNMYGYRSWMAFDQQLAPMIKLYGEQSLWTPGWNQAECLGLSYRRHQDPHDIPGYNCMCGYWAYWNPQNAKATYLTVKSMLIVSGVIQARGDVVMQERGFRAGSCRVVALAPHPGRCSNPRCVDDDCCDNCLVNRELVNKEIDKIGKYYRVPVFPTFNALLAEFPPTHEETRVTCPDCQVRLDKDKVHHLTTCTYQGKA